MFTAQRLRNENIAEYLLYMWQTEDLARAYDCNDERIANEYISRFDLTDEDTAKMRDWYADLCNMMRSEGVTKSGHLQINKNVVQTLDELSQQLLLSSDFSRYHEAYYRALPHIAEIRAHGERNDLSYVEICFDILYGVMLLRIAKKNVSPQTAAAAGDISAVIGLLAAYYKKNKQQPLDI